MSRPKLLVAYSNLSTFVPTTIEYLRCFKLHSYYEVSYLHVTHGAEIDFDFDAFDAVFHSYCARFSTENYVSDSYIEALKRFRGVRLVAFQDEYEQTNALRRAVQDLQFDVVFTCVPNDGRELIYPTHAFPQTEFVPALTGYVPEGLKNRRSSWVPLAQRPVTIGYRGRRLAARYGRLGFEKFEIGRCLREICSARGIAHDIEMREEERIYGDAWYDFLGGCRVTLGSESGSNCFDFDGSLAARYQKLTAAKGRELSYEEFRKYTDPLEDLLAMGQISPRVFEAAALGTPMIMFAGHYSGIVSPETHYIALDKAFSNVEAVLRQVEDIASLEGLAERAYQHLIASGTYDYRRFVETVDAIIDRKRAEKAIPHSTGLRAPGLCADGPVAEHSLQERPTAAPRDPAVLLHKQAVRENLALSEQVARLEADYPAEIARLHETYTAEIKHLGQVYPAEIERLQAEYTIENARLRDQHAAAIAQLSETYTAEIARLNDVYPSEIERLKVEYTSESARLRDQHAAAIVQLKDANAAEVARLNIAHVAALDRIESSHRAELGQLRETHSSDVARLQAAISETEGLHGLCLLSYRLAKRVTWQLSAGFARGVRYGLRPFIGRI